MPPCLCPALHFTAPAMSPPSRRRPTAVGNVHEDPEGKGFPWVPPAVKNINSGTHLLLAPALWPALTQSPPLFQTTSSNPSTPSPAYASWPKRATNPSNSSCWQPWSLCVSMRPTRSSACAQRCDWPAAKIPFTANNDYMDEALHRCEFYMCMLRLVLCRFFIATEDGPVSEQVRLV